MEASGKEAELVAHFKQCKLKVADCPLCKELATLQAEQRKQ